MILVKKAFLFVCVLGCALLLSCKKDKVEPSSTEEPTLEEIHAKGAKTLNELLLEHDQSLRGEGSATSEPQANPSQQGYGAVQKATHYGFTTDTYLFDSPRKCYLNIGAYQGYYFVEVHVVSLKIKAKPFSEYEQGDSPHCGYIPTTDTTAPLRLPIRGCFNDGYQSGGRQFFRTYYIKILKSIDGKAIHHTLPDYPKNFEWNIVYREAL